jgi:hypothetical protein
VGNPLRYEADAFRVFLYCLAVIAAIVVIVLVIRTVA